MMKTLAYIVSAFTIVALITVFTGKIYLERKPSTITSATKLIYNPSDDREVVGAFHDIFTGKVLEQLDPEPYDAVPQTQYLVEVAYSVKGELTGKKIVVSQLGSYRDGIFHPFLSEDDLGALEDADKMNLYVPLQAGSSYLFATRYNPDKDWYVLSTHPSGFKLLSNNSKLVIPQILELSQQDGRVKELEEAYKNEIIPYPDLMSGNAPNQYKELKR